MAADERSGGRRRSPVARAAMRALRGARDLYVRGARGFGKFIVAANPRARVGRPTSRVFGVVGGDLNSEQELRELVRAMQARRDAEMSGAGGKRAQTSGVPASAARRGAVPPLGRIGDDDVLVHPTK